LTFIIAFLISFSSENLIKALNLILAFFILIIIILIGIIFDIVGVAVTAAKEPPFHAMSADKVKGAKEAVKLIRNADIVSNFCNDVIGDISGTISGAAGAAIVLKIFNYYSIIDKAMFSIIVTSLIATLTVGGKAIGKGIAISRCQEIVLKVGLLLYYLNTKFRIQILKNDK
jgi:CBS domain containing-hemolysin-like protein